MRLCDVSLVEIFHLELLEADVELVLDFAEHAVLFLPTLLLLKLDPGLLRALRLDDLGVARMVLQPPRGIHRSALAAQKGVSSKVLAVLFARQEK